MLHHVAQHLGDREDCMLTQPLAKVRNLDVVDWDRQRLTTLSKGPSQPLQLVPTSSPMDPCNALQIPSLLLRARYIRSWAFRSCIRQGHSFGSITRLRVTNHSFGSITRLRVTNLLHKRSKIDECL